MDFLKHRFIFLIISLSLIISGITYGIIKGYKFDIDFKGGTRIQAEIKQDFSNNDIENLVKEIVGTSSLVQKISGGEFSVSITTEALSEEQAEQVAKALKEKYTNMEDPSIKNVQPSFGREIVDSSIISVIVAITAVLVYVGIRFKTLGVIAAITAVIALMHDALVIVAIYGFARLTINSTFIAVILTIIGYSINDTIIIYDRIRDNRRKVTKSADLRDIINVSISQTMTRTIYTSLTTLAAISIVYIFAYINNQQILKEFALPLIIGIVAGAYSSIFIATSLWYMIENVKNRKKAK